MKSKPIYVEAHIKAPMETLWTHTQTPDKHQQWDLRFSEITYLPKAKEDDPQQFLYKTKIGFGLSISGEGESVGNREKAGVRTSSLTFSSNHPISLISEGGGFWRYVPADDGIQFLTRYDYKTRFGPLGSWFDRLIFRPIMGWATAWSFDCLRLWLEQGIPPYVSIRRAIMERVATLSLFIIWVYQGLVPKLLVPDSGEMKLLQHIPILGHYGRPILILLGVAELIFGFLLLFLKGNRQRKRWHKLNILVLILLGLSALSHPVTYVQPFNPFTLNLAMIALSVCSLSIEAYPKAGRCLRSASKGKGGSQP